MGKLKVSYTIDYDGERVRFDNRNQIEMLTFSKYLISRLTELECRLKQTAGLHWIKQKVSEENSPNFNIQFFKGSDTTSVL